ncbi:ThiF family adenylyltransferase [Phenylobacterium sp. J426]|nr:ThiF family adenylyltransferase [Phenylobacterium sp. J426]
MIWALARDPGPVGAVHLVDHEAVELTNLQRYVLSTQADVGRVKVEVARTALLAGASRLEPLTFLTRWDDYVVGRGHPSFDRVVVGLDSAADRIAVQAALPRRGSERLDPGGRSGRLAPRLPWRGRLLGLPLHADPGRPEPG